ncbi:hypothetical protein XENOCAPTIV_011143, partial [Xenoophorus captivus]
LTKRKKSDVGRRLEMTGHQNLQAASGSARKIPEPETEESKDQRTDGSDLRRVDNIWRNSDHAFPLDELSVTGNVAAAEKQFLGDSNGDGETPPCKHKTDLQPAWKRDELQPSNDRTDAERRASSRTRESSKENIYHSVLHQLLQQQKHKPGRKHKKKTLMKMAKLLVIAKGWDRREDQRLSLEEESSLKEDIFNSMSRKHAPGAGRTESKPEIQKTAQNLSRPSDPNSSLNPASDEQKEYREISSEFVRKETKIPPDSREQVPKRTSKRRQKAAKVPKVGGKKKHPSDETCGGLSGSNFTCKNKEEKPHMDPTGGKNPELTFKKKTGRNRIGKGKMVKPSETQSLVVSSGRKRKKDSVTRLQPAPTAAEATAESDTGLSLLAEELMSSKSGSSGSAGNSAAPETQPHSMKKPRKDRNPTAVQLPTGADSLQAQNQTLDVFPKSSHRKLGKRGDKTKTPPISVWDSFPCAETPNILNEPGKNSNMQRKRATLKGKRTKTFHVKEETNDRNVMCGTFSQKQDGDPIQSWNKPKCRGHGKQIIVQTLNFHIKTEPVWEAATNQSDVSPIHNHSSRRRKLRKRKPIEDDDATAGSAGDEAGGDVEHFLPPVCGSSEKSRSRNKKNPGLHNSDDTDEGLKCRKIRRSCTLGNKTISAAEEWLIRYLKGSRRRASSKGSDMKAEGNLEGADLLGEDEQDPMSENRTQFIQTKRSRGKNARLSVDGAAIPGNVKRKRKKTKEEPASAFDEGGSGFPNHPAPALGLNRQEEPTMKGKGQKPEDVTASRGQTGATLESSESKVNGRRRKNLIQIHGITPDLKDDSLEVQSKMMPRKRKGRPKKKHLISKPKILESKEEQPHDGDTGPPEDVKTSHFRRSRRRNVSTRKMKDGSSLQDRNSTMDSGGQTRGTPERSESSRLNLLQIEGTSDPKGDFLGVNSKVITTRRKMGRKRRRMLKKDMKARPKILESDEDLLHVWVIGAPEDEKTSNVKRGRKKNVFTIKMEDEASCLMDTEAKKEPDREKPELRSSFQDKSNTTKSGGKTRTAAERRGMMNLLQIEGVTSSPKDDSVKVYSKVRATKRQTGRKRRQTLKKDSAHHKILECNEDQSCKRDAAALEDGKISKTSNVRRGRKRNVFTIKVKDEASCFIDTEGIGNEPEREKSFQESVSSAAPRKTIRKRRRRSKTHWAGNKKAKKPRICSFWDNPAFSSSCAETFNVQLGNQENQIKTNFPSGPKICHRLQKKMIEKKNLQCSFCLRSFRHISAFTLHKRLHAGRKPYGCSICAKNFSKLSQLKLHSKVHSVAPAARCPCCDETFKDKTELICHLKVHLNEVETLQTELGRNRQSRSAANQDKTFRCSICSKEFTKTCTFEKHQRIHDRKPLSCTKMFRDPSTIRGFLVSQVGNAAVVTPVFFKCPICKQIHRFWCHYVLHLQSHTSGGSRCCDACRQDYSGAADTRRHCSDCCKASGEDKDCGGFLNDIWKEGGASGRKDQQSSCPEAKHEGKIAVLPKGEYDRRRFLPPPLSSGSSLPVIEDVDIVSLKSGFSSTSDPTCNQVSLFHPEPHKLRGRTWRGRWGRASTHWNKQGLHSRLRQRSSRAFRCSCCELEFHFLGSYMDHLQEHAAERSHACPSCPGMFSDEAQLKSHVSSCHRQPDGLKCSTCGKLFSTPRNLQTHKLLHKGARSHICLPCSRSFSCHSALKAHLETHRRRLIVPQPARMEGPFLFPYPCRKCSAKFSSTDLLQAHQVCHFIAGRNPESPPESIMSFSPNIQRGTAPSSGPKRQLPVSNRKDLFRYPHPDHLYVVQDVSSEPPVGVSDTVEETNDSLGRKPTSAELELHLLVKSLIPEKRLTTSDSSDSESELTTGRANYIHTCAICAKTFPDVMSLHEHYRNHARGM